MIVLGIGSNFTEAEKRALEQAFSSGKLVGNEIVRPVPSRYDYAPPEPVRARHAGMNHSDKMRAKRQARRNGR